MKYSRLAWSTWTAASLLATVALADVDPIVIKGTKFFYKTNGTEFYIKGVAYQQAYSGNGSTTSTTKYTDPLADVDACKRDVPLLQELQTNTIRVYAIDPTKDHSQCMKMLQDAGIYVVSDLSDPQASINRESPSWNDELYARYTSVIDELAKYNNVLGFFAGNEVANAPNNTQATPYVKAAVRDMKAYIKRMKYRPIGVGYATSDDPDIRTNIAHYFNCGPAEESADFWGYNIYSWCGSSSSYQESGYKDRTAEFANYSVPVFFAEYGCNTPSPRVFDEVQALYGSEMTPVWSGGIVYLYFQEANNYGLVSVDGNTASKLPDFSALQSQIASATPSSVDAGSYTPTNTQAQECPPTGKAWNASSTLPPTPNKELCGCLVKNLTCVAKTGISSENISKLFGQVCGLDNSACDGIVSNGSAGKYGAVSMCSAVEQLSWAFNAYYVHQGMKDTACDFGGNAQTQNPTSPSGSCDSLIGQVGPAGTGTVTTQPSGTAGSGSGNGGSTPSSTKKPSAAGIMTVASVDLGMLQLGAYVMVATLTGAAMIVL